MTAASLIANLRNSGVTLRCEGARLVVEGPAGIITPEIHAQLLQRKGALLAALAEESSGHAGCDCEAADAVREIGGLLALAYRRYSAIQVVGSDPRKDSGDAGLANPRGSSVHGVVP